MKKRCAQALVAAFIAAFVITTMTQAQEQRRQRPGGRQGRIGFGDRGFGMRGGSTSLLSLLRIHEVRKELKLDDTQQASVRSIEDEVRGDQPRGRVNFRELSQEAREKYFAERRARAQREAKAAKEKLPTILSEDQMKRLTEISLQVQGVRALSDPEFTARLKLTDEQKGQIQAARRESSEESREKMRELFQGDFAEGNRDGMREKFEAIRKEADAKVLAVLTKEQQEQFEDMKGKSFDMPRGAFGFGQRGGRGGPGARGRGGFGGASRKREGVPDRPKRPPLEDETEEK